MSNVFQVAMTVTAMVLIFVYPVSLLVSYAYFQCKYNYTVKLTEHMLVNAGPT